MIKTVIAVLGSTLLLAGCANPRGPATSAPVTEKSILKMQSMKAEVKLAEAAVSASQSLQQLAQIESAVHPEAKLPPPLNPYLIGMEQPASINWIGPIEPLIKRIAKASHYRLHVLGTAPAIPIIVTITAENKPLATILRNAGFQGRHQAKIAVYPGQKIIELRYLS